MGLSSDSVLVLSGWEVVLALLAPVISTLLINECWTCQCPGLSKKNTTVTQASFASAKLFFLECAEELYIFVLRRRSVQEILQKRPSWHKPTLEPLVPTNNGQRNYSLGKLHIDFRQPNCTMPAGIQS